MYNKGIAHYKTSLPRASDYGARLSLARSARGEKMGEVNQVVRACFLETRKSPIGKKSNLVALTPLGRLFPLRLAKGVFYPLSPLGHPALVGKGCRPPPTGKPFKKVSSADDRITEQNPPSAAVGQN